MPTPEEKELHFYVNTMLIDGLAATILFGISLFFNDQEALRVLPLIPGTVALYSLNRAVESKKAVDAAFQPRFLLKVPVHLRDDNSEESLN